MPLSAGGSACISSDRPCPRLVRAACKIPPGELESVVAGLIGTDVTNPAGELVGLDDGDDAAVVRIETISR